MAAIGAIAEHPLGLKKLHEVCSPFENGYIARFASYPKLSIKITNEELSTKNEENHVENDESFQQRIEAVKKILPPTEFFWILPPLRPQHVSGDILVRALEIAYAKLYLMLEPDKYVDSKIQLSAPDCLRIYHHKGFHYDPATAIHDITNWPAEELIANGSDSWWGVQSFAAESKNHPEAILKARELLKKIASSPNRFIAIASSVGEPGKSLVSLDMGGKMVPFHDYVIQKIDLMEESIYLRDPYNSRIRLVLEFDDFMQYFNMITTASVVTE